MPIFWGSSEHTTITTTGDSMKKSALALGRPGSAFPGNRRPRPNQRPGLRPDRRRRRLCVEPLPTPNTAAWCASVSGGKNTSRWGLRGTEDLGGGLKAVFNLEGGILMDTGAADGALFKRQAYVGLEGSFGRVVIGRSFTSTYDTVIKFDPMGFAPNYSWATVRQRHRPEQVRHDHRLRQPDQVFRQHRRLHLRRHLSAWASRPPATATAASTRPAVSFGAASA
jgi:hypothetical protein